MRDSITITIYSSLDEASRLAEKIAREAQVFLAREYGIPVEVVIVEVPMPTDEAREAGLPTVLVEDREVAEGRVPLLTDVVDAVFEEIREEYGLAGSGLPEIGVIGV